MTITLTPEIEAEVTEQARRNGGDVNSLVESYVKQALEWEKQDMEITRRSLESCEAGRTKPAAQVIAEMREMLRKGV